MTLRRFVAASAAASLIVLAFSFARAADPSPQEEFDAGNRFYAEKSYKKALEKYLAVQKLAPDFEHADELNFRIGTSHLHLRQWSEAEAGLQKAVKGADHWKLRSMVALAEMYRTWPHEVYVKGDVRKRGEWFEGASYEYTEWKDAEQAMALMEEAKKVGYELRGMYEAAKKEKPGDAAAIDKKDAGVRAVLIELNFALSQYVASRMQHQGDARPKDPAKDAAVYDPKWTPNEKVVFLLEEVARLDESDRKSAAAKAARDRALWVLRRVWYFQQKPEDRPLEEAIPMLREAIVKYPASGIADDIQYMIALALEERAMFVDALVEFRKVVADHKDSKWASDAQAHIQGIEAPRLNIGWAPNFVTGQKVEIGSQWRNIGEIQWSLHEYDLAAAWQKVAEGGAHDFEAGDFAGVSLAHQGDRYRGAEVASWKEDTADDGRHAWRSGKVTAPVKKAGAYLLAASANGLTARVVILVSDMVVVERVGSKEGVWFVADAMSGAAVDGAEVRVVERVTWWDGGKRVHDERSETLKTGADGKATWKLKWGDRGSRVQAMAAKAGQFAATGGSWHYGYGEGGRSPQVFAHTDRPVYRPGQTVNFKATARLTNATGYEVPKDIDLRVIIHDPQGNAIYDQTLKGNDLGSVAGSVKLGEEPPLGWYNVSISGNGCSGHANFGVEEYKKPEVLVEVVSKTEQARLGEGLTAEINATYYFGGGVPNADVHYTVTRSTFYYWWRRSEEFDWYYGDLWDRQDYGWDQEVVLDGNGKTDENGKLLIEWSTAKAKTELPNQDHVYNISCQVTDSSRRTIEGSGSIRVTRTQMFATLTPRAGFFRSGDHVEVELATQNANGQPLPSTGAITVARMVWDSSIQPNGNWKEEPIFTDASKTDDNGRGFFRWQTDSDGYFAVTYETKDAWDQKVVGKTHVHVANPNGGSTSVHFRQLELHPEQRTWKPGETAKLLLTSDTPGATVFLTVEAQYTLLRSEIVKLEGKTRIVEIPLEQAHTPNFFVRAVTVRDGNVHQEVVELFVPPADKFLEVSIKPSKPDYKPGEKARYEIEVKDWKGNPAATEVCLTVIDKSVLYIRPENVPDVRLAFYGGRRYAQVNLLTSRQFGTSPHHVDTNRYKEFKMHGVPDGWQGSQGRGAWDKAPGESATTGMVFEESERAAGNASPPSPAADAAPMEELAKAGEKSESRKEGKDAGKKQLQRDDDAGGAAGQPPAVRKNFADTATWAPWIVTGADGRGSIEFTMPDSLTTWRATARAFDGQTRVGITTNETVTRKTVMIRLQAPRFFRERDELLLSAIVNNQGKDAEKIAATLKLEGGTLELSGDATLNISIPAGGEARVDWKVKATKEGLARITVTGIGQADSDAMMMEFPVYVHGMDKLQSWAGVVKGDTETATLTFDVPADRKVSTADLVVQVSPTMAGALLDALPYLIEYPYGCVEQTMSRFMPAVVVANTLKETGVSLEDIGKRRALAYADLHPSKDPVFHTQALAHIVSQGLQRLYGFQNGAGGWGWWQSNEVDPFITAYVVNGLRLAKAAGFNVDEGRLQNGVNALARNLEEEKDLHRATYCAYVLAECGKLDKKHREHLFTRRGDMNSYGRALLAMAMHKAGDKEKAEICIRNMEDFVKVDEKTDTAFWDREEKWRWWYWYGDDVEGNSAILRAYMMVDSKNANIPRLAKWLLMNRDGVRWKSTRDTAHAILALCEFAKQAGELSPEYTLDVELDGKPLKSFGVTADNVFTLHGETGLKGDAIETGKHTLTMKKSGKGTAYWSLYLKYFTTEEDLKAGSSRMSVSRAWYRLTPKKVETNENGRTVTRIEYVKEELKSGATVTSGDLIEIEMTIDAPNDYEYLVFEDMKAAGCEPTEVVSGYVWGSVASNREFRDEKVAFFVSWLPRGQHKISYKVRAEIPGSFHAMPVNGYAMYAPGVRAISDEFRINIEDKKTDGEEKR